VHQDSTGEDLEEGFQVPTLATPAASGELKLSTFLLGRARFAWDVTTAGLREGKVFRRAESADCRSRHSLKTAIAAPTVAVMQGPAWPSFCRWPSRSTAAGAFVNLGEVL